MSRRQDSDGAPDGAPPDGLLPEPQASQVTSQPADDSVTVGPTWSVDGTAPPSRPASAAAMGRYTLLGELGSGGMGVVYKAWDPALDRPVALKVLLAGRLASQRHLARFLDEARAIARLDHPALVEVYDIGLVDGCPYFTMEFVAGSTLERASADGPMDPVRACRLLAPVAHGLASAHAQGIVHRDLKPANILVDGDDRPRLIDFGVARFLESTDERTRTGQVVGTPAYMAPEQAMGRIAEIGPATDIFGLGATLYRVVTGFLPQRLDLGSLDGAPRDLLAICVTAMSERPQDRYPSMAVMADELERFARGEPVQAALPGFWRRTRWRLREARGALLGATVAAVLAGLGWLAVDAWEARRAVEAEKRREAAAALRLDDALLESARLRADGDADGAARLEETATLRPEVQETRALARFHLQRTAEAEQRRDRVGARSAAASAFATARHPQETADGLIALGRIFAAEDRVDALRAIIDRLAADFPQRRDALDRLRLDSAMAELRFADAAALAHRLDDPRARLLDALSRAHRTEWTARSMELTALYSAQLGDVDGDGRRELYVGRAAMLADDPRLPAADLPPIPAETAVSPLGEGLVDFSSPAGRRLMRLAGTRWQPVMATDAFHLYAIGDLARRGRSQIFAFGGWRIRELSPAAEGWVDRPLHPASEAARIVPRGAHVARFAGGDPVLVVTSGGWLTHDIRIFAAAPDGGLTLVARRKVGEIAASTLLERPGADPLIGVVVRRMYPEPRVFPPDEPSGYPPGVHLFEWSAEGITHVRHLPIDMPQDAEFQLTAGDLDGDGQPEVIISHRNGRLPMRIFGAAGRDPAVPLIGFDVLAATQLDRDPPSELVVYDTVGARVWALGAGGDALPTRPGEALPDAADETGPAAIHELARLGLFEQAIDAWQREIRLGREPTEAAWHAARTAEGHGRVLEAADFYLQAAEGRPGAEALRSAARAFEAALDWPAAHGALQRLVTRPEATAQDRAAAERLSAQLEARLDLKPAGGLDDRVRILVPDRLRVDHSQGALEVIGDRVGPIARVPLRATGGPLAVEVAMRTPRLGYFGAVQLTLAVRAPDGETRTLFRIENVAWGGGSIVMQRAMVTRKGKQQRVFFNRHVTGTGGLSLHARVMLDPVSGRLDIVEYGQRYHSVATVAAERLPRAGEELYLDIGSSDTDAVVSATVRAQIDTLILDGMVIEDRPLPADEAALHAAGRALAEGRPHEALELLGAREDEHAAALRVAALYDLGRMTEADATVSARLPTMTPSGPFDQLVRGRLRRDPLHMVPLVRATLGPDADAFLQPIFVVQLDKHPTDPETGLAARALLLGASAETRSPTDRMALLLARSAHHRRAGRIGASRSDLDAYRRLLEALPPATDAGAMTERGRQWSRYHLLRSESDAQGGDIEGAARAIRAGLAIAPAPEIFADRLRASAALRPVHGHAVWPAVERAATWSDGP